MRSYLNLFYKAIALTFCISLLQPANCQTYEQEFDRLIQKNKCTITLILDETTDTFQGQDKINHIKNNHLIISVSHASKKDMEIGYIPQDLLKKHFEEEKGNLEQSLKYLNNQGHELQAYDREFNNQESRILGKINALELAFKTRSQNLRKQHKDLLTQLNTG